MENKGQRIHYLSIDFNASILSAIKQMDANSSKLLLVFKNGKFQSLISIGDIQRAILKKIPLRNSIASALRTKVRVCRSEDTIEFIKTMMFEHRTEFMPILDGDNNLVDVIFWEEVFETGQDRHSSKDLNIPVVIMAGGKGTRLKPITNIIPKPLVPLGEKPIMQIIMEDFESLGVKQFFATVNYKADMIRQYFDGLPDKRYSIKYFLEEKPLGTAGSLSLLKNEINGTFFVTNCDILVDQDYSEVYQYHKESQNELTAIAALQHYHIPYGTMEVGEGGKLLQLTEKPDLTFQVNAGVYLLEPHLLHEIPENTFFHITHLMEKVIARGGKVGVFPVSQGSWMDIGEWPKYSEIQESFKKRFL